MDSFDIDALDEDQQEDVPSREGFEAYRENLVFLIDASPSMFVKAELDDKEFATNDTWFHVALRVAREVLMSRIISSDNDQISVVFYGTRESKNANSFDNIHTALDLDVPDARRIRELKDLLEDDVFEEKIGSKGEASPDHLRFALWTASQLLGGGSAKASKRILIFTNDVDPTANTANASHYREQIMSRVQDLRETKVAIEPFPMIAAGQRFMEDNSFWQQVLSIENPDELAEYEGNEVPYRLSSLHSAIHQKAYKKRVLSSLRWHFGDHFQIAIQLFALIQPATKSATIPLMGQTNEPVRSEAAFICTDTGAVLTEWMHRFPKPAASDKPEGAPERFPTVLLTNDDKRDLHTFASPGLRLLGFKPLASLKDHYQLRNSTFVYPDERAMSGSTVAFIAFHSQMVELAQVAICSFIRNRSSEPRMVALLAQEESVDEYGAQVEPPGMHMIYLPYADDLREPEKDPKLVGNPKTNSTKADKAQVQQAEALIDSLVLGDFLVTNPVLQRHYQVLEAFALDEDPTALEVQDETRPDAEGMQAANDKIIAFRDAVYGEGVDDTGPVKRAPAEKKRKAPEDEAAIAEALAGTDYKGLAQSGKLSTLTVKELQVYCEGYSLPKSGKKAGIIDRILRHMGLDKGKGAA
ncbi:hypothetical protein WJX72_003765 [[Myrmecia] bisecta]|uniref:SAP domain-containing protein n=1 Tax=[Myrmecia] bisecta TaxID=41462 RepID=A0AAW1R604_9CHLO